MSRRKSLSDFCKSLSDFQSLSDSEHSKSLSDLPNRLAISRFSECQMILQVARPPAPLASREIAEVSKSPSDLKRVLGFSARSKSVGFNKQFGKKASGKGSRELAQRANRLVFTSDCNGKFRKTCCAGAI